MRQRVAIENAERRVCISYVKDEQHSYRDEGGQQSTLKRLARRGSKTHFASYDLASFAVGRLEHQRSA